MLEALEPPQLMLILTHSPELAVSAPDETLPVSVTEFDGESEILQHVVFRTDSAGGLWWRPVGGVTVLVHQVVP